MNDLLDPAKNPVTFAIPFFIAAILIELAALRWLDHDNTTMAPVTGYERRDSRTSILMGLGSLFFSLALKIGSFGVFAWLYVEVAPFHLPTDAWWSWVLMIVAVDFAYYWQHRFVHRARVGWAAHQAHHSSEYMNFGTALRQKWNPWFDFFFWLPLPLLGVAPWALYFAFGINLIYQFFVHTELVDKMWRPIEFIFNTPSHHRVHHGSDAIYLDKNYAGMLIIWDRMFGTFVPETHRPTYGLTKQVTSYNVIKLEYGDYRALWEDLKHAESWRERFGYLFAPPGWAPAGKSPTLSTAIEPLPRPTREHVTS